MATRAAELSTQLLVQFLAAVSRCADATEASTAAAERAAAAFESEVAAVIFDGVVTAVGFPRGKVPRDELLAIVARKRTSVMVPGVGPCAAIVAPLQDGTGGHLLVARFRADGFAAEESNLLRGMARTLDLVLVMLRTLDAERTMRERSDLHAEDNANLLKALQERHHLLEQLMSIQRAISRRAPLAQVLNTIVTGTHQLLDDEVATLCLLDGDALTPYAHVTPDGTGAEPGWLVLAATKTASSRAILTDELVVYSPPPEEEAPIGTAVLAAIAAPVHENGRPVGALVVGSVSRARIYTSAEKATLAAFAEHVSLAISDARTLEDMREAHHDSLTGLASRRLFMDRLQQALAHAKRTGATVALLFLDLDRFKMVNDTLGHRAGDTLLCEIADRLRQCLRADDSAARLGGDEFAVLLQGIAQPEHAVDVAERILRALREPILVEGRQLFVDASIGLVTAAPNTSDVDGLVRDADVAMYEAKRSGAGRTAVFRPEMRDPFKQRVELENDLRHAIDAGELRLHYQPVVDMSSGHIVSVEALLRWEHPTRGLLAPLSFIPMAEETGLILPVGEWVLREACKQAQVWRDRLGAVDAPTVSVNISGRQLKETDMARQVARALANAHLDAGSLILEITESVVLNDDRGMLERLHELKALGVRLAVDDFGAGYSSLSYLRSFPFDVLKVDKSFIDLIATDPDASSLARAIIGMGRTLRLQTVAEGIETAAQLEVLQDAGCDLGQGYYFSRPLEGQAFLTYLLEWVRGPWSQGLARTCGVGSGRGESVR